MEHIYRETTAEWLMKDNPLGRPIVVYKGFPRDRYSEDIAQLIYAANCCHSYSSLKFIPDDAKITGRDVDDIINLVEQYVEATASEVYTFYPKKMRADDSIIAMGFLGHEIMEDVPGAHIEKIVIHNDYRGKHLATPIVEFLTGCALDEYPSRILMTVSSENTRMLNAMRRVRERGYNYVPIGQYTHTSAGSTENVIAYALFHGDKKKLYKEIRKLTTEDKEEYKEIWNSVGRHITPFSTFMDEGVERVSISKLAFAQRFFLKWCFEHEDKFKIAKGASNVILDTTGLLGFLNCHDIEDPAWLRQFMNV